MPAPLSAGVPLRRFPVVTLAIVAACVAVHVLLRGRTPEQHYEIAARWGSTPERLDVLTALTASFLHFDAPHLALNASLLLLFGPAVEDRLGRLVYPFLTLAAGAAGMLAHAALAGESMRGVPVVGASGALSGVLGAFLILTPRAWIRVFGARIVPAWIPLALFLGVHVWAALRVDPRDAPVVALWAHLGGFAFGVLGAFLLKLTGRFPAPSGLDFPR